MIYFGGVNISPYICNTKMTQQLLKNTTMKTIEVTMQEIWMATRPIVQKSKKDYTRKRKHKNQPWNKND